MTEQAVNKLAVASLGCLAASLLLSAVVGGYGQPPWLSMAQLLLGWHQFTRSEGLAWLPVRSAYLFSVWCGLRAFVQSSDRKRALVLTAGIAAMVTTAAGIAGYMLLPRLAA